MGAVTFDSSPSSTGKGNVTYPGGSGQPALGQPSQFSQGQQNQYGNTVGGWDNASIVQQPATQSGKGGGKGQQQWQPFQPTWNPSQMNLPDLSQPAQQTQQDIGNINPVWQQSTGM